MRYLNRDDAHRKVSSQLRNLRSSVVIQFPQPGKRQLDAVAS